jgi:hypothetical protein
MANGPWNISQRPIKLFLDAVDSVLNSNTFLLPFAIHADGLEISLLRFLKSDNVTGLLAQQDMDRGWYNLHYFDSATDRYRRREGHILKDGIQLEVSKPAVDQREYLIAMLTGDTSKGRFFSFYATQKNRKDAERVVDEFTSFLSPDGGWDLFVVRPDFLKSAADVSNKDDLRYFESDSANDTATIISCNEKGFLLLTNGIP